MDRYPARGQAQRVQYPPGAVDRTSAVRITTLPEVRRKGYSIPLVLWAELLPSGLLLYLKSGEERYSTKALGKLTYSTVLRTEQTTTPYFLEKC